MVLELPVGARVLLGDVGEQVGGTGVDEPSLDAPAQECPGGGESGSDGVVGGRCGDPGQECSGVELLRVCGGGVPEEGLEAALDAQAAVVAGEAFEVLGQDCR